jgi:demethyldecarbamoylnovobiocin O-methyltransferase
MSIVVDTYSIEELKKQLLRLDDVKDGAELYRRIVGLECWPKEAETMIGLKRMDNIQYCIKEILKNNIPGDLIETGVWRGGACIFMRGILRVCGITDRKIFVADSFKGFPDIDELEYPMDKGATFLREPMLSVSRKQVEENFRKYGLLDKQVVFIEGWFKDTLPKLENTFSLLRLDGDLFESTWDALVNLYRKLSIGGYIIIDDYSDIEVCKKAVDMFRNKFNIIEEIIYIDHSGIYWKKER